MCIDNSMYSYAIAMKLCMVTEGQSISQPLNFKGTGLHSRSLQGSNSRLIIKLRHREMGPNALDS